MGSILGINAHHGDSSACLLVDGIIVAAAEEERFRRIKHWAGFPAHAIRSCLEDAGVTVQQLDHVAINRNPNARLLRKVLFAFSKRPNLGAVADRLRNASKVRGLKESLAEATGVAERDIRARVHGVEHHRAHLASAFLVSPFESAAVVSVDGFGDFASSMWGMGNGNELTVEGQVFFPHSLGLFYLAMTQFLGFHHYGDEYQVMGLAAHGSPRHLDAMRQVVRLQDHGRFELELDYFRHHSAGVPMTWDGGKPEVGRAWSDRLVDLLGPPRDPEAPISAREADLAASVQAMYEEAFFHLLNHVWDRTRVPALCLSGGCAMNSLANGRVFERTEFRQVYVQPSPGDAGGAIGAAAWTWNVELGHPRRCVMDRADLGPRFDSAACLDAIDDASEQLRAAGCHVTTEDDPKALFAMIAQRIADGNVIGWFQGRMEWGPRALGNRSILADPRRADMRDVLNLKIKRRDPFRPFAPSILREHVGEWFDLDVDVPFMSQVLPVREEQRRLIPAVTHKDGTGRLQTVTQEGNERFHGLISAFHELTDVPILLNTSFNENEPIVHRPAEAIACFVRTNMDVLVLGEHVIERPSVDTA